MQEGKWCGIEFKQPLGENNGTVEGVSYFVCQPKHGKFVRPIRLHTSPLTEVIRSRALFVRGHASHKTSSHLAVDPPHLLQDPEPPLYTSLPPA